VTPIPVSYPTFTGVGALRLARGEWRVVVVGASGWLGLSTVEMLHELLGEDFARRVVCFGSSARHLRLRGGRSVEQQPLSAIGDLPPMRSLVLHNAFLTQEKAKAMPLEAYLSANQAISGQVLNALDRIGAEAVFVPSSGAVYMANQSGAEESKRIYGQLKLEDETKFAAWAAQTGRRAVISRIFNLSGPYINKQSSYALACFIADALAGRAIAIQSARRVYRSYVAIDELMSVVIGALTDSGAETITFDTAGEFVYEMAEIAEIVRSLIGDGLSVDRPALLNEEPDYYIGDGEIYTSLRRDLSVGAVGFPAQVRETARFMAENP